MSEEPYRLIYVSTFAETTFEDPATTFRDILVVSDRLNRRDGITGLLIAWRGAFVQVLEGPEALVEACYARIARDPRHLDPEVRLRAPVAGRLFPRWSMCGRTLSSFDNLLLEQFDFYLDFELRKASAVALLNMLELVGSHYGTHLDQVHRSLVQHEA